MNIFDFENKVRSASANVQHDLNMDRLLGDLNLSPPPRSSSRKYFYFLGFALLIGLSTAGYFYFSSTPTAVSASSEMAFENQTNNTTSTQKDNLTNSTNTIELQEKKPTTNNTIQNTKLSESSNSIQAPTTKTNAPTKKAPVNINQSNGVNFVSTGLQSQKISRPLAPTSVVEMQADKLEINPVSNQLETTGLKKADKSSTLQATNNNNTELQVASKAQNSLSLKEKTIALLPLIDVNLESPAPKNLGDKVKDCPSFGNRLWHMSLVPEVGYSFPQKTLNLVDEGFSDIFDERVQNEKTIEGIHAGISLQFKNHVTGLYVKPGFSYSRFTEQLSFTDTDILRDTTIGIIELTTNPAGDTTTIVTGPIVTETELISKSKVHYQLHQFELPVAIGYSFDFKDFSLDIEGGIKLNFLQKTNGRILVSEGTLANLDGAQDDIFKNSVGLGFFGGAFIKKQMSSHSEIYFGPRFTYNTLSFSTNQNPIQQRYNVFGLHAGITYAIF